ncbi:unnamed protein product [Blepharisma stoltei]|uniref:Uncharacterized protein n=1 Tax=Blepharisma stoltei TaxID=1481888 RepID=A0AAU9IQ03_9CILI|nr:unnamed protein product [Blepharisma stoltei]
MYLRRLRRFASLSYSENLYNKLHIEEGVFSKNLRFLKFCDNMTKLAKKHEEDEKVDLIRRHNLKMAALTSREPVRDILNHYMNHRKDYSADLITEAIEWLGKVGVETRWIFPKDDMSVQEVYGSFQFKTLLNDLDLALNRLEYMSPLHLARCAKGLAQFGYKDSNIYKKLIETFKVSDDQNVPARTVYKDHIYSGFMKNQEFQEHIATLLEWKAPEKLPTGGRLENNLAGLVDEVETLKLMHKDMASAVLNVSAHYFSLVDLQRNHPDLKEDPELALELFELQESLVKARLLDPNDLDDDSNFINMDKMMKRAAGTFSRLMKVYYPHLASPIVDSLFEASTKYHQFVAPNIETPVIPNPNELTASVIGKLFQGLAEAMYSERADPTNEYPFAVWGELVEVDRDPKGQHDLLIDKTCTNVWWMSKQAAKDLVPRMKEVANKTNCDGACEAFYGLGLINALDPELIDTLAKRVQVDSDKVSAITLANGIYGLGLVGRGADAANYLISVLMKHKDFEILSFGELLGVTWAQCVLNCTNNAAFNEILKNFNRFEPQHLEPRLSHMLREVKNTLEIEFGWRLEETFREPIVTAFRGSDHVSFFEGEHYHPYKKTVKEAVRKYLSQGLTDKESDTIHNLLVAANPNPLYKMDDIFAVNGKKVAISFVGDDRLDGNEMCGQDKLRKRHLEKVGFTQLLIPLYLFVNTDPIAQKMSFNENADLAGLVLKTCGLKENFLAPVAELLEKLIEISGKVETSEDIKPDLVKFIEEFLGAFKLQRMSRFKTEINEYKEALEEIKIQLFKTNERYWLLTDASRDIVDQLVKETTKSPNFNLLIKDINEKIPQREEKKNYPWVGIRQGVELPTKKVMNDISDELLNQGFLWISNYYHYDDWEEILRKNFVLNLENYMKEDPYSLLTFFGGRRQAYGILPNPGKGNNLFSRQFSDEASLIASLQNLKYGIKRNLNDQQIVEKILDLKFIPSIIKEHLSEKHPKEEYLPTLLPRDPKCYIKFIEEQQNVKRKTDHFVNYFKNYHLKNEFNEEAFPQLQKSLELINENQEMSWMEKHTMKNNLICRYMNTRFALEKKTFDKDIFYHEAYKHRIGRKTDQDSLTIEGFRIRDDPDYLKFTSDEDYLEFKTCQAETNLIKMRLIYKLHNNQELSEIERQYLKKWGEALKKAKISDAGSVLVPQHSTSYCLNDMDEEDALFCMSFRNVVLKESFGHYSLNELIFELSHFFDDEIIRRIEYNIIENYRLGQWGITTDASGISRLRPLWRNKSIWLTNLELEEILWSKAGELNEEEIGHFLSIYGHMREKAFNSRQIWKIEKQSILDWLAVYNGVEGRLKYLKEWYIRKTIEREANQNIPRGKFYKPDAQLSEDYHRAKVESAKKLIKEKIGDKWENLTDGHFQMIIKTCKDKIITSDVVEDDIAMINAILFHEGLSDMDREEIETLKRLYKFDEKEENEPAEHLFVKPVPVRNVTHTNDLERSVNPNEYWKDRIEQASGNFIANLINKIKED